ncbi:MAG: hypothetical protein PVF96_08670 [Candidatus Bathyarchaeota archaeon]
MGEKKDFYGKAKEQMRLSERILAVIPGFGGYKEKELRRESDKLIRKHLHGRLSQARDSLKTVSQRLSDRRWFDELKNMDRLVAKLDRLESRIEHASYGYSGFFDVIKVKETNLDEMISFDNTLIDGVNGVVDAAAYFQDTDLKESKDVKLRIEQLVKKLEELEKTFDKRSEVILGVS